MARVLSLFVVLLIATLSAAQLPKSKAAKKYNPDEAQTPPSLLTILQSPEADDAPPALPVGLELPREEAAGIPFYTPEPGTVAILKAPLPYFQSAPAEFSSQYPVPSQELQVPSAEPWNPSNDPKYYYELPPIVTKQELPTNLYPKKYNKDVYEKQKPFAGRPKQEISLHPISEQDYLGKQKNINKVLLNLAKVQNQKLVESEKVQSAKFDVEQASAVNDLAKLKAEGKEPQAAASGFSHGFDGEGLKHTISANSGFNHGLNAELSGHEEPVGLHVGSEGLHAPAGSKNRMQFHMHGHDGPHSYKWGFDTGKGHNRQFRFEERDKHGYVKGHYGYYDKHGKLQVVHYDAHPDEGYHAEGKN